MASSPNQTLTTLTATTSCQTIATYSNSLSTASLFGTPLELFPEQTSYKLNHFKDFGNFNEIRLDAVVRGQIVGISRFDYSAKPNKNYKEVFNIDLFDGTDIVRVFFYDDAAREYVSLLKEGESFEIRKPIAADMAGLKEKSSLSKQFYLKFEKNVTTCENDTVQMPIDLRELKDFFTCYAVDKIAQLSLGDVIGTQQQKNL